MARGTGAEHLVQDSAVTVTVGGISAPGWEVQGWEVQGWEVQGWEAPATVEDYRGQG